MDVQRDPKEPLATFSTSNLYYTDLLLINILLTAAKSDRQEVKRACKFVLDRINEEDKEDQ